MRNWKSETGIAKPELRNRKYETNKCEPWKMKLELRNRNCATRNANLEKQTKLRNRKYETRNAKLGKWNWNCETRNAKLKKKRNCETGNTKQEMRMAANFLEWNYWSNASRQACGKLSRMNLLKECIAANFLEWNYWRNASRQACGKLSGMKILKKCIAASLRQALRQRRGAASNCNKQLRLSSRGGPRCGFLWKYNTYEIYTK